MLFTCLFLLTSNGSLNVEYTQSITYTVIETKVGYRIHSVVNVEQKLLSEKSFAKTKVLISESHYVSIKGLSGAVNGKKLKEKDITSFQPELEDVFLSDLKIHFLNLSPGLRQGDVVEYEYEQHYADPAFISPIALPNIEGAQTILVFNHPEDVHVQFEFFFPREEIPYTIERQPQSTKLVFPQIPQQKALPYFPFNETSAYVMPYFEKDGRNICNSSEKTFNDWFRKLVGEAPEMTPESAAFVQNLTREFATPYLKLQAINDYVKNNIKYLADETGKHAVVPRMPEVVLKRQWGDCKDKALLVREMARVIGIDVEMALIATDERPSFEHVRVSLFNHVICAWREQDVWRFFDPTQRNYPFGALPLQERDKPAFVFGEDTGSWVRTPRDNHLTQMEITIRLNATRPKDGLAYVSLYGDLFAQAAEAMRKDNLLERELSISKLVNHHFRKITFRDFYPRGKPEKQIYFMAKADVSKFLIKGSENMYVPMIPFQVFENDLLTREQDSAPIYLDWKGRLSLKVVFHHDEYQTKPFALQFGNLDNTGFMANLEVMKDRSELQYVSSLDQKNYRDSERKNLLSLVRRHFENRNLMFIFSRGETK